MPDTSFKFRQLRVSLRPHIKNDIIATISPNLEVIPTGIFNSFFLKSIRNPGGQSYNFDPSPMRVPLFTVVLENRHVTPCDFHLITSSKELGIENEQVITVLPGVVQTIPYIPDLEYPVPLFRQGFLKFSDESLEIATVKINVVVEVTDPYDSKIRREILSRKYNLSALPPDFMVWNITNRNDYNKKRCHDLIARWITPDTPEITHFLAKIGLNRSSGNPQNDLERVWNGLSERNFSYDMDMINTDFRAYTNYQRIRLIRTIFRHNRINCIDGTMLLASCMERLGYECLVVIKPGHVFFGLISEGTYRSMKQCVFLESTGLCSNWTIKGDEATFTPEVGSGTPLPLRWAANAGNQLFAGIQKYLLHNPIVNTPENEEPRLAPNDSEGPFKLYFLIPVLRCREMGIKPQELDQAFSQDS